MGADPFGGSEELWTRTATLLIKQGVPVAASAQGWPQLDRRISELSTVGVDLRLRPVKPSLISLAWRYVSGKAQIALDIERSFGRSSPSLVVISEGGAFPSIDVTEMCVTKRWPFATVVHSNLESWWPTGELAARYRKALPLARRCFFVCQANRILAERQLGCDLDNAEVVRNPLTIEIDSPIPWPLDPADQELRMACVGRFSPEKGHDILFDALANSNWKERNWRLTLYGKGRTRDVMERLVVRLKLQDRVSFAGHVAVDKIWRENHVLVMPSRFEGMPLTVVEAMFAGRPVVATNVGGISELVREGVTGFLAEAPVAVSFGRTLEQMWEQRDRLQGMGKLAAAVIREFMPKDPVGIFAEKLKTMMHP
ncbi:MAG: glycosyltransferase [Bradyrhizobium sp.]|uniref:glycosyltransferase n=1 Tax=Bradyrhizobium sp. TaxID=376 RepID=UPI001C295725|nr:glycosyltransferase [Bradyrhizobium sp.]MBU6461140.1 glycosyltransferase [Pseudomonadota bacterium]MDE2066217.1 glycosyltransferase [Bradyrhizobium sp.]